MCSKFTGKHPCRRVILIKLLCNFIKPHFGMGVLLCNFIEITLRYGCSPINLLLIFKTPFYNNTSRGLLLIKCSLLTSQCPFLLLLVHNILICFRIGKYVLVTVYNKHFSIFVYMKNIVTLPAFYVLRMLKQFHQCKYILYNGH